MQTPGKSRGSRTVKPADPESRRILNDLADGRARTARELGAAAGQAAAALAALQRRHLVRVAGAGRHRYYALCAARVAAPDAGRKLVSAVLVRLRTVRTCYDHLGGSVAVTLFGWMLAADWLCVADTDVVVTPTGIAGLGALGIDVAACRAAHRRFAYACLDWSERQPHLAGALGAALLEQLLACGWLVRAPAARALGVTAEGRRALAAHFACEP
jgi:hypothetical protein